MIYINGVAVAVPDIGEGHITILPHHYNSIVQGTWVWKVDALYLLNGYFINDTVTDGDSLTYKVYLSKGTYTLRILVGLGISRGIVDFDIDGDEVASFDMYNATVLYNVVRSQTGIVIASGGLKTLTVRLDGKNPSSSRWDLFITTMALWRTA